MVQLTNSRFYCILFLLTFFLPVAPAFALETGNSGNADYSGQWTQINPDAGWPVRAWHSSVVMPDGSIVMMGGMGKNYSRKNDVWRSADNGMTWTLVNSHAGWSPRYGQTSVVLPDGSIVLMGGYQDEKLLNDTWMSTDMGITWTQMNAGSPWPARWQAGSVALPDGSILLMGGGTRQDHNLNDVWRSTDSGTTWNPVTLKAGWSARRSFDSVILSDGSILLMGGADSVTPRLDVKDDTWRSTDGGKTWSRTGTGAWGGRYDFSSVVLPDDSIIVMGGLNGNIRRSNDIWRSADYGKTWSLVTASAPWSPRYGQDSVMTPDGNVVLTGGSVSDLNSGDRNDVWRLIPAGGSVPAPTVSPVTDTGTWLKINANAGWPPCLGHSTVVMPDGRIILTGGADSDVSVVNSTWQSVDNGATWSLVNARPEWEARWGHTMTVMPDGSILLMGGSDGKNDVWRSTDNGASWSLVTKNAEWSGRYGHSSVLMPDGRLILLGGYDKSGSRHDIWQSADYGKTWDLVNANPGWAGRDLFGAVLIPDGSIVVMGGQSGSGVEGLNDIWQSADGGRSWNVVNVNPGWSRRLWFSSLAMPDGSIIVAGGLGGGWYNDVWQSKDGGTTWSLVTANPGWTARYGQSGIVMPDGSIILTGGYDGRHLSDVWRYTRSSSIPGKISGTVLVTKDINPSSMKAGTDARITITVSNPGTTPVHDIEIADTMPEEFLVVDGTMQHAVPAIEANGTRNMSYSVTAKKPGTFRLPPVKVMYADEKGDYRVVYSGYKSVVVLESLLRPEKENEVEAFSEELAGWFNGLDRFLASLFA